ncbi:MAG: 23S rRNA (guanosine(2251)-2'-O)-methyltransferase RlmB [Planctomycetaceae bacterium]|nr:23S rRNA (guanosine(2251)-2'-O)-methyltransferase RlmB [Planctomycetaceae bacterium]
MSAADRSRKPKLMGNHQRSWIWGRHAVLEAVRSERWFPLEVRAAHDVDPEIRRELADWIETRKELAAADFPPVLEFEEASRLENLCHQSDHQGLIARMPEYPYLTTAELLANLSEQSFLLVLDGIQDAFNFGACLRCAEVFGVDAVLIGTKGQTGVNSQVVRSSAGAVHHVPIARASDLTDSLTKLQSAGVTLVASTEKAEQALPQANMRGAIAVIVGNEGTGIAAERLELASRRVAIPQQGIVQSLNAAVATGIVLYEAVRQREYDRQQEET